MLRRSLFAGLTLILAGCTPGDRSTTDVTTEVETYLQTLLGDLAEHGPMAWLDHFDHGPQFYMVSDGVRIFPDFAAADSVVRRLATRFTRIEMTFDEIDVRPMTADVALFASPFHESLTGPGEPASFEGFVTGSVVRSGEDWVVRHLHWSSPPRSPEE